MGAWLSSTPKLPPVLWHGSPTDVKGNALEPRPSRVLEGETAVFATDDKALALVFLCKWSDADFALGYDDGQLYFAERNAGAFSALVRERSGWVYTVSSRGFHSDARLGMPHHEFVRAKKTRILDRTFVPDIWQALRVANIVLIAFGDDALRRKFAIVSSGVHAPPGGI